MYMLFLVTQTFYSHMDCSPPGSSVHENSPVKNTGAGYHAPGDLPNPGIEPRSPALQADSLPSEPPGNPKNTVAYPFSRGSSWLRNWTRVSCLADGFFTNWAIRKAQTGVGSHSLLQGIFPTQGMNSGLLHCRQILYCLNHQKSPEGPCIYICIHTHTHIYIYIYACVCVHTYILKIESLYTCTYTCALLYTYTHLYAYKYLHTYKNIIFSSGKMDGCSHHPPLLCDLIIHYFSPSCSTKTTWLKSKFGLWPVFWLLLNLHVFTKPQFLHL